MSHQVTTVIIFGVIGCGSHPAPAASPYAAAVKPAPRSHPVFALIDSAGARVGQVTASEDAGGAVLEVFATGLTPGRHGLHLHATPACEPPGFQSAGGHFNPTGRQHGAHNPQGAHVGDLPNLVVNDRGEGRAQLAVPGYSLSPGPRSIGAPGTALVIHAGEDDETTDPTGNSGPRIGCAVIMLP